MRLVYCERSMLEFLIANPIIPAIVTCLLVLTLLHLAIMRIDRS